MSVPPTGAILAGKYALHRRLGAGGYGAVYEGENVDLGKRVAIKLIAARHAQSEEAIARFRREARASAKIESANIVQVFDVGADPVLGLYMVMELLRGEDLRRKLDRAGKLTPEFAVDIAHQIACGLAKAHAVGVVHRDLKPANVFLHQTIDEGEENRVVAKLVDFGVAKLLDEAAFGEQPMNLTTIGKTVGTPQYMSPEQVQGLPFDHRGDLWSLGAVLYEMLTGHPAFPLRETFQQTALSIVNDEPAPLRYVARDLPVSVIEVVERALAKDPDQRFPDATALADALMAALPSAFNDDHAAARVAEIIAVHPRRPSARPRAPSTASSEEELVVPMDRRRVGVIVAIAILAAAAAILVIAAARTPKKPAPVAAPPTVSVHVPVPVPAVSPAVAVTEPAAPPEPAPPLASALTLTSASASGSASVKPAPKPPEQFGGTGVTSNF